MPPSQKVQHGVTSVEQCCEHWNIKIHEDKTQATVSLVDIDRKLYKITRLKMPATLVEAKSNTENTRSGGQAYVISMLS
jgi:hypothetical protein